MKPEPITVPVQLRHRLGDGALVQWAGVGNTALLEEPLLGLISSRECPSHVLVETLERVKEWEDAGRVIVSGFHSPLEQQVLRSFLRREGRAVKVLARGISDYLPPHEEREAIAASQLLILTAFPSSMRRITRDSALKRNWQVAALSAELVLPYVANGSPIATLLAPSVA